LGVLYKKEKLSSFDSIINLGISRFNDAFKSSKSLVSKIDISLDDVPRIRVMLLFNSLKYFVIAD
jgi:hypothetical protein